MTEKQFTYSIQDDYLELYDRMGNLAFMTYIHPSVVSHNETIMEAYIRRTYPKQMNQLP